MKTVFLNIKTSQGVETVDEFSKDEHTDKSISFGKYVNQMVREYRMSGMNVYKSQRCTKEWRSK